MSDEDFQAELAAMEAAAGGDDGSAAGWVDLVSDSYGSTEP